MFKKQKIKIDLEINGFNGIYYFNFDKNFSHKIERHNFWEMIYVDDGSICALGNKKILSVTQGQALFYAPNKKHAHTSNGKVTNNILVVCFSCESEALNILADKVFTLDKTTKTLLSLFISEAKNALGKIPGNYNDKSDIDFSNAIFGSQQLLQLHLTELLIRLIRTETAIDKKTNTSEIKKNITNPAMNELIIEYLNDNIYSTVTIKDLCTNFLIGKTKLYEVFRDFSDVGIMEYYSRLKINEAKKLLKQKNLSVTQVSDMLSYSSLHNFSRAFKQHTGMSPTAYIKSIL